MIKENNKIVIIGGGHNGLTCAAYLARAGREVTVLEASEQPGGLAATREFAPGFRASVAHLSYLLDQDIVRELDLPSHGLAMAADDLPTTALDPGGEHITLTGSEVQGTGISDADRLAYGEYRRFMSRFAGIIGSLHNQIPPRITTNRADFIPLAKLGWKLRRLGRDDMREFLRIAAINIYDVLEENFESPLLKGALSLDALLGTFSGPRSNNSVFTALHRMSGNTGHAAGTLSLPAGGMGAVTDSLAAAARKAGADIRTGCRVQRIICNGTEVRGVEMEGGERVDAAAVVSSVDPKSTVLSLLGARHVEAGMARRFGNIRSNGHAAKLHLALDGLPGFSGLPPEQQGNRLLIAPTMDYLDHAFNPCKYGEFSPEPALEIILPSLHDDSLAPPGKHVLSAVVQYAPRHLKGGWEQGKPAFTEAVLDRLGSFAPGIREKITAIELLTPEDIESRFGNSGGHWHHAELSLDQFLMLRPVPKAAQYRAPVEGLYLCGAGCHPGGGVMGSAGRNAARAVLEK